MDLSKLAQAVSGLPSSQTKIFSPSSTNGEPYKRIINMRQEESGEYSYLKLRSGSQKHRTLAGQVLTLFGFTARVGEDLVEYTAIHTTLGDVSVFPTDTTNGEYATGVITFDSEAMDVVTEAFQVTIVSDFGTFVRNYTLSGADAEDLALDLEDQINADAGINTVYEATAVDDQVILVALNKGDEYNGTITIVSTIVTTKQDLSGGVDQVVKNQIVTAGTFSTSEQIQFIFIGNLLYMFGGTVNKYWDPSKDEVYNYGAALPKSLTGYTQETSTSYEILTDNTKLYFRAYVVVDLYNDGSYSPPSHPIIVASQKYDMGNVLIKSFTATLDVADSKVVKRFLYCTKWIADKNNNSIDDYIGYDDIYERAYFYGAPEILFTPSSEDNPNGIYFFSREIEISATSVQEFTKDVDLIEPLSAIVDMTAGVHNLLLWNNIDINHISSIQNTMLLGGYGLNRPVPSFFEQDDSSNQDRAYIKLYPSETDGPGPYPYFPAFQFKYFDESFSRPLISSFDDILSAQLKQYNRFSISSISSQVQSVALLAYRPSAFKLRFGGVTYTSIDDDIEFLPLSGNLVIDGDLLSIYYTLNLSIDGVSSIVDILIYQEDASVTTVEIDTISLLIDAINEVIIPLGCVATFHNGEYVFQHVSGDSESTCTVTIDVDSIDLFYNLSVTTSGGPSPVLHSGTTSSVDSFSIYNLNTYNQLEASCNGFGNIFQIDLESEITSKPTVSLTSNDYLEIVDLREFILSAIPPQTLITSNQARIFDRSKINSIIPVGIDSQRFSIRYTLAVFTDRNIQWGYLNDTEGYFNGDFEIVTNAMKALNPKQARLVDRAVFFRSDTGIALLDQGQIVKLASDDEYGYIKGGLINISFSETFDEVVFSFVGSDKALVFDKEGKGIREYEFNSSGLMRGLWNSGDLVYLCKGSLMHKTGIETLSYDDDEPIVGEALTGYLSSPSEQVKILEICAIGQNGNVKALADLQKFRSILYPSGSFTGAFNRDYESDAQSLSFSGANFFPKVSGPMTRIGVEITPTSPNQIPILEHIRILFKIITNKGKGRE